MAQAKIAATDDNFDASRATSSRKKGFMGLAAAIVIAAVGYGLWYYFVGSRYVSTDNAYSAAEVAEVTPSVTGIVQTVNVVDTQAVKQGDVLVQLDDTDARLALAQAEANLGQSRRRVSSYMATDEGLAAQVKAREADETQAQARLVAAQSDFTKAQVDLKRREALAKSGAVSGEELTNARNAMAQAESNLNVAKAAAAQATANRLSTIGAKKANAALTINATVETNPEVMLAKAKVEQAQVDLARTVIKAPVDGVIARRQVQVGQRVQNGERLMSVVPLHDVHVDANFKEVELRHVKIGQPVEVTADIYGDKVVYHGVVSGVSGGTGSAFSMIPAQNATGNWIKVVQRLPLRITLDKNELAKHPLQVGLSMIATIDTRKIKKLNTSDSEGLATARQD
ncbi:HlyD family secretion protein [Phytobacter diazotrophicus]|uniref:HlyD family secretion protein n=1 Tax=Phytobacter diazotrophicus TaxID=395631 RepID=UPI00068F9369|nr:HlyD family secretion protein [Phytobacter diazotrophicus]MDU4997311.1 HlyD family secretion protein [Enterobacteriaceae bacterium]MDU4355572.1 HlyD family secretion protein [Phytobacter diazotrophicus]MDU7131865.1 HlyD family secretion protein [Enterobacteriaceae bacterium]MDU7197193.1 HlyD family secretion protein [Enterobacteriaceae bacterium]MDV2872243.1 HlyD family secretion protein [Phytobacter diazotrophicus]